VEKVFGWSLPTKILSVSLSSANFSVTDIDLLVALALETSAINLPDVDDIFKLWKWTYSAYYVFITKFKCIQSFIC